MTDYIHCSGCDDWINVPEDADVPEFILCKRCQDDERGDAAYHAMMERDL